MANKRLNAVITIGGAVSGSLKSAFDSVKGQVGQVGSALKRLEAEQRTVTNAIQTFGRMGKNVDGLRERYAKLTGQIERLRSAHLALQRAEAAQQANAAKRAEYRSGIGETLAIGAIAAAPIKIAADRESHALGIAKQMQGSRDEAGNLTKEFWDMRKSVVSLGHEIPLATNDLLDMATAGLRMGVAKDEILDFTRNTAKLASALELPAEQVGDQFGKIKEIYKLSLDDLKRLGDSVNYLDDQNVVKGGELIDFLQRVGGSAGMAKVTAQEMAGIGTALISLGETAETASTSTRALFTKLAAGAKGTKAARSAIEELGLKPGNVAKGMNKDALGTIRDLMARIGKMAPDKRTGIITSIFGLEHVGQISKLVTGMDKVDEAVKQANEAYKAGTSVQKEFQNTVNSTNSQLTLLRNRVGDVGDNIGTVLLPAVNDIAKTLGTASTSLADFAQAHPMVTKVVVGTAVSLVALRVATFAAGYAFTVMKGGALQMTAALARMQAGAALASARLPAVAASIRGVAVASRLLAFTPVGAVITALAVGGALIYKYWDGIKAFIVGTLEGLQTGMAPVVKVFADLKESLGPVGALFDAVGTAVQTGVTWFTNLLQPVTFSKDELGKAGAAGKSFGEMLAAGINIVTKPLQWLMQSITWVSNNIGGALEKVKALGGAAGSAVGGAWNTAKNFVGLGSDDDAPGKPGAPALPSPQMATARNAAGAYTDSSTTTIQIVQQPGESQADLARRVAQEQERARQVRQRGSMLDGATSQ